MARRASRGKLIAAAAAALLLVLAFYLRRDLNLPREAETKDLPDVVVESLTFERTIEGRDWVVRVDRAEHQGGVIAARSIDIDVAEPETGDRAHITARSGEFSRESSDCSLSLVEGSLFSKSRSVDWSTPHARYDASADVWTFERGFSARDGDVAVSGDHGTITSGGVFILRKGAEARWMNE